LVKRKGLQRDDFQLVGTPSESASREVTSHPADEEGCIRNALAGAEESVPEVRSVRKRGVNAQDAELLMVLLAKEDAAAAAKEEVEKPVKCKKFIEKYGNCRDPSCKDPKCGELLAADADMGKPTRMRLKRGITMDTGAHDNVIPKRMVGRRQIRASKGSRKGMRYVGAGGEKIHNEGEVDFPFESVEGHKASMVFQIAEVNKPLGSVAYFVDRKFRVVYDQNDVTGEDMSYMIHKPTKKVFRFRRSRNIWILDAVVELADLFGDFSGPE
jgi:hypothetical protein